jgi:hypothetical protein
LTWAQDFAKNEFNRFIFSFFMCFLAEIFPKKRNGWTKIRKSSRI